MQVLELGLNDIMRYLLLVVLLAFLEWHCGTMVGHLTCKQEVVGLTLGHSVVL